VWTNILLSLLDTKEEVSHDLFSTRRTGLAMIRTYIDSRHTTSTQKFGCAASAGPRQTPRMAASSGMFWADKMSGFTYLALSLDVLAAFLALQMHLPVAP